MRLYSSVLMLEFNEGAYQVPADHDSRDKTAQLLGLRELAAAVDVEGDCLMMITMIMQYHHHDFCHHHHHHHHHHHN